ncbi:MAG: 1-acyl-sn-glycerol-3-phosphate acyltransferase [Bacteroidetes bacterium]|nr:1-acyl-sn-glycerol-3-phosphate acyltransferase [Bacteroidota bacterium]
MNAIRSALTWAAIGLLILLFLPLMAVTRLFDRDPAHYATGRMMRKLGGLITKVNPAWKVQRTGTIPENMRNPYVVVCNHQSTSDPPVVSTLPWEMKWVGKASLFKLPVVGWMMRLAGDIPIDRGDRKSRASVLVRARVVLENRCSVMLMPEGTRSKDGRVRQYQDGAFRLAIEMGLPVLPIALDGTASMLPKHGWKFGQADLRLHVFDPVPTVGLAVADVATLRERVRQTVIEKIAEWRGVAPEEIDGSPERGEKEAKSTEVTSTHVASG